MHTGEPDPRRRAPRQSRPEQAFYRPPRLSSARTGGDEVCGRPRKEVEILGRFGKINDYEFMFECEEDASTAASSLRRFRDIGDGAGSLVRHVEAPKESAMGRKSIVAPLQMRADLEEAAAPNMLSSSRLLHGRLDKGQAVSVLSVDIKTGSRNRRRLLGAEELLLPEEARGKHWHSFKVEEREAVNRPGVLLLNSKKFDKISPQRTLEEPQVSSGQSGKSPQKRAGASSMPYCSVPIDSHRPDESKSVASGSQRAAYARNPPSSQIFPQRPLPQYRGRRGNLVAARQCQMARTQNMSPAEIRPFTPYLKHVSDSDGKNTSCSQSVSSEPSINDMTEDEAVSLNNCSPFEATGSRHVAPDRVRRFTADTQESNKVPQSVKLRKVSSSDSGEDKRISDDTSSCEELGEESFSSTSSKSGSVLSSTPPSTSLLGPESSSSVSQFPSMPPVGESRLPLSIQTFEFELERRFPAALSRRLLSAMWIGLYYAKLKAFKVAADQAVGTGSAQTDAVSQLLDYVDTAITFFESLLEKYRKRLPPSNSSLFVSKYQREGNHFLCHLCIILGDLCRHRDAMVAKTIQSESSKVATKQKEELGLFKTSLQWYIQAMKFFPQEGHIYSQWAYLSSYHTDMLGRVLMMLYSIICCFRYNNHDRLIDLLESLAEHRQKDQKQSTSNLSPGGSQNLFVVKLLTIVKSIYSKIGLELFDEILKGVCTSLGHDIAASIPSSVFDQVMYGFVLVILLSIQTSNLWMKYSSIGDSITAAVNGVRLNRSLDQSSVYVVDDPDYNECEIRIRDNYNHLPGAFSDYFNNIDIMILINSNERFKLSIILLIEMTVEVIKSIKSPLSPLLAIVYLVGSWLLSIGLLHKQIDNTVNTSRSQSILILILKLRNLISTLTSTLHQSIDDSLTNKFLTFSLPEDYQCNAIAPIEFCISTPLDAPLLATIVSQSTKDTKFVCSAHSCSLEDTMPPDLFGPFLSSISPSIIKPGDASLKNVIPRSLSSGDWTDITTALNRITSHQPFQDHNEQSDMMPLDPFDTKKSRSTSLDLSRSHSRRHIGTSNDDENIKATYDHLHIRPIHESKDYQYSIVRVSRVFVLASTLQEFQDLQQLEKKEKTYLDIFIDAIDRDPKNLQVAMKKPLQRLQQRNTLQRLLGNSQTTIPLIEPPIYKHKDIDMTTNDDSKKLTSKQIVSDKTLMASSSGDSQHQQQKRGLLHVKPLDLFEHKTQLEITERLQRNVQHNQQQQQQRRKPNNNNNNSMTRGIIPVIPSVEDSKKNLGSGRLIVIDGANVAMRHGGFLNRKFSSRGIQLAVDYYITKGFNVIVFVPDYVTRYHSVGGASRAKNAGLNVNATHLPDNVQLLRDLAAQGYLTSTPAQDHDDSYIIKFAQRKHGCIVTNDLYRDHVEKVLKRSNQKCLKKWFKSHLISFTFIGDEFMPNPDFQMPDETDDTILEQPEIAYS